MCCHFLPCSVHQWCHQQVQPVQQKWKVSYVASQTWGSKTWCKSKKKNRKVLSPNISQNNQLNLQIKCFANCTCCFHAILRLLLVPFNTVPATHRSRQEEPCALLGGVGQARLTPLRLVKENSSKLCAFLYFLNCLTHSDTPTRSSQR